MTSPTIDDRIAVQQAKALESPRSAYVHIPFCAHKCGYCDFASVAGQDELADRYLDALEREMAMILGKPVPMETIFIGGGTPTYIDEHQLARLLDSVRHWLVPCATTEFTVESNPNTLTKGKVDILTDYGVNRVSLGAQSFDRGLLRQLERNHEPASVGRAIDLLRPRIENISLDLIFGIPGQSLDQWRGDLSQAMALAPTHLSAYALTYEKGTPLWKQRRLGVIEPTSEDLEAEMYELLLEVAPERGYEQYEISNFAKAGAVDRRCRHNLTYWANAPYFGFGTGAAAYIRGNRTLNLRPLITYMERVEASLSPICQSETLDDQSRARETAVLRLRLTEGLNRESFLQDTGVSIDELAGAAIADFVDMGFMADDGHRIALTRKGLLLADGLLARIV